MYADIETDSVAPPTTIYSFDPSFEVIADDEHPWEFSTHQAPGAYGWFEYDHLPNDNEQGVTAMPTYFAAGSFAEFHVSLIPGEYDVFLFHYEMSSLGSAVPHQVYDGAPAD